MRHRRKKTKLGRTSAHRKAMLSNMACSLILHKRIRTTLTKAKILRQHVEPIITRSKNDTTHSRRMVFSKLQDKYATKELFTEVAPRIMDRPGGYTRILKLGPRRGDNTEMALIELVDFNEYIGGQSLAKPSRSRRRTRRGGSGASSDAENTENQSNADED